MSEKIGLVLEGGGTRGMYTAGILDVFLENNIEFDGVIGVSAGALFGVNFLSKQHGRAVRYNKKFNKKFGYMGLIPLLKEGNIVSTEYAYDRVPKKLDPFDNETFMKSGIPFYAVLTNVETGKAEYVQVEDVFKQMDCLRASGSLPFVSKPVEINGKSYLDGGITDSIPYEWMLNNGYSKVVVILTRDLNYRKKPMPAGMVKLLSRGKNPKVIERLSHRHEMYNNQLDGIKKLVSEGKLVAIRPSVKITASKLEKNEKKLQEMYDEGREDALKALDNILHFTGRK